MARHGEKEPKRPEEPSRRSYVKQSDVPAVTLDEALRVPQVILDNYAGKPTSPLHVGKALSMDPKGSQLRLLSGAAIAFGLTEGGAQAPTIAVTDLARRILRPTQEGDHVAARREAVLRPRVFGEFLHRYDKNPFPRSDIAVNVLEELGVPRANAHDVLTRVMDSARSVGFLEVIKDKTYVSLEEAASSQDPSRAPAEEAPSNPPSLAPTTPALPPTIELPASKSRLATAIADDERRRKVFITHGKNRDLVEPIRKLLEFGEMSAVVSVERQSVSKPVPEKVMDDMSACGAAIIHVDAENVVKDANGQDHVFLNPNVLIEIGAAMAFYGRRFILLVRDGVKLPSNLQGLYEVRYKGENLDATSTIALLEAIKDIKNHGLPTDEPSTDDRQAAMNA